MTAVTNSLIDYLRWDRIAVESTPALQVNTIGEAASLMKGAAAAAHQFLESNHLDRDSEEAYNARSILMSARQLYELLLKHGPDHLLPKKAT